jgi:hypothetical protein
MTQIGFGGLNNMTKDATAFDSFRQAYLLMAPFYRPLRPVTAWE